RTRPHPLRSPRTDSGTDRTALVGPHLCISLASKSVPSSGKRRFGGRQRATGRGDSRTRVACCPSCDNAASRLAALGAAVSETVEGLLDELAEVASAVVAGPDLVGGVKRGSGGAGHEMGFEPVHAGTGSVGEGLDEGSLPSLLGL